MVVAATRPKDKEDFKSSTIICRGGWNSNKNWLEINEQNVGLAVDLINFEPSLFGGYRRINGFAYLEDTDTGFVDSAGAEGRILGIFFYNDNIWCARKQQSGATYEFYEWSPGNVWTLHTTGLSLSSTGVTKIYYAVFNFDGTEKIIFADGVNNAVLYDGTTWVKIDPVATGADYANAGGAMALSAPTFVHVFKNHIFMSRCGGNCHRIAHSSPNAEYDWVFTNGAGQLNASLDITRTYPWRDELFVFGTHRIRKVVEEGGDFVLKDVTNDLGCVAADSVVEINSDLIFLSGDGIRTVQATERVNDVELGTISKAVQEDVRNFILSNHGPDDISILKIPSKSQFRMFFTPSSDTDAEAEGIIGGIKSYDGNLIWEFGKTLGIKVACAGWGRIGTPPDEYILHGTYDGKIMRQEFGNSFNGVDIYAQYATPYLDFGAPSMRKTPHQILVFTRPEGAVTLNVELTYDWGTAYHNNPSDYSVGTEGNPAIFGFAIYGTDTYGGVTVPTMVTNVQGSGRSLKITFSTTSQEAPYSIQGMVIKYEQAGFK
jgi:hypothetical protein